MKSTHLFCSGRHNITYRLEVWLKRGGHFSVRVNCLLEELPQGLIFLLTQYWHFNTHIFLDSQSRVSFSLGGRFFPNFRLQETLTWNATSTLSWPVSSGYRLNRNRGACSWSVVCVGVPPCSLCSPPHAFKSGPSPLLEPRVWDHFVSKTGISKGGYPHFLQGMHMIMCGFLQ